MEFYQRLWNTRKEGEKWTLIQKIGQAIKKVHL